MEITWKEIETASNEINYIDLKGKQYAEVKERVIAFRKIFPLGRIVTDMIQYTKDEIIFKATAYEIDDKVLATGYAREKTNKDPGAHCISKISETPVVW